jgi:methylenetetrahydrofolate dehydrogenase (NADP+)/methenyltetrahydrofolate cyclohydrolase
LAGTHGVVPALAVVLVGKNPASQVYVKAKSKRAIEAGLRAIDCNLPETATEQEVMQLVGKLNDDKSVHGILVQLPLPGHVRTDRILRAIEPSKDVDGFHPINAGYLAQGQTELGFVPCTPLGCLMLLRSCMRDMSGKNAIVVGRSNIVGKPMAQLLLNANCTVTMAHSKTVDLAEQCRRADILIAAIGKPEFVKADWIKAGAAVIDVGINRVPVAGGKSKIVGDVAFEEARRVAGWITPVPGGVGPMTIACLLANTVTAACRANNLECSDWLGGQDVAVTPTMPAFARVP